MTNRTAETSPLVYARLTGLLLVIVAAISAFSIIYVPSTLIVPGDATATADNDRASGGLFHLGIVSDTLIFLTEIVLSVLRGSADRSWPSGGTTFPAVASPALSDESTHDDDHLREGHPEVHHLSPPLRAPNQLFVGVVPGASPLHHPPLRGR